MQYEEDGAGREKSRPIAYRETLVFGMVGDGKAAALEADM